MANESKSQGEHSEKKDIKDFSISPEIEKYMEKLVEDPNSRVFAPLAEAYRKSGMLDEAIQVCLEGLKIHPAYVSGRVALARAYHEKKMLDEAKEEFEKVVKSAPDNLLAHKCLGDIYHQQGDEQKAAKAFKMVSLLNPNDKESLDILKELQGTQKETTFEAESSEEKTITTHRYEESSSEAKEEIDLEPLVEEIPVDEQEEALEVAEEFISETESTQEISEEESSSGAKEEIDFEQSTEEITIEEEKEETELDKEHPIQIEEQDFTEETKNGSKDELTTDTLANLYIEQGYFDKAADIYRKILDSEPENNIIRQKLEEIYFLQKMSANIKKDSSGKKLPKESETPKNTELSEEKAKDILPSKDESQKYEDTTKIESKDKTVETLQGWLKSIKEDKDEL